MLFITLELDIPTNTKTPERKFIIFLLVNCFNTLIKTGNIVQDRSISKKDNTAISSNFVGKWGRVVGRWGSVIVNTSATSVARFRYRACCSTRKRRSLGLLIRGHSHIARYIY